MALPSMPPSPLTASVAGRFARQALELGEGEVVAVFRRSFYLRFAGERYACVGDESLGRGPLNALVADPGAPAIGERLSVDVASAEPWTPPPPGDVASPDLAALKKSAAGRVPPEGFGCLIVDSHNALSGHAQPALDALERWLVGNSLGNEIEMLVGLGPGLTPSGDDLLGGMMIALTHAQRASQAQGLWRWLQPRLAARTSAISAAHLNAAAAGEGHEALHACLGALFSSKPAWDEPLRRIDAVGHCSGWDALAGALLVARAS